MNLQPHRVRPDWMRRLNQFGPATGDPRNVIPLDPDEMLATARQSTGLREIGSDAWLETYRRRIQSIDRDSGAHLIGRLLCRGETIRVLQTRLRLEHAWAENPKILEEPIEQPVFIAGPPRTGTTILLELLALDPQLRAPIAWEAHHPIFHDDIQDEASAMAAAEAEQELWADIQPELMTLHELRSDLPCECVHFMSLDFGAGYWSMFYPTPSFDEWAATQPDLVPRTYREHRRFLQTLQYGKPRRRWLLKSPVHLVSLPQLIGEYPDAVVLQTHRDPLKFVGSAASTTAMLNWLRCDEVDRAAQGQLALLGFAGMLGLSRALRDGGSVPDGQFVDIRYEDLVESPASALRGLYERASLDWPDGHAAVVEGYLRDKPKGKFGKHEYTLDEYGLSEEMVLATYADYVADYGIGRER
ncbi:MAG: sulfotransferase [Myxococcota bacterium]|jgi:hypothetical protein|nr:sulfotransferase [Myxococcota bacterium]